MLPRQNIWDRSPMQQSKLKAAILKYVADKEVVKCHEKHHELHTSGYYFLIGHRKYIEGLETYLREAGILEERELLPRWDPSDPLPERRLIPPEFVEPSAGSGAKHNIWAPLRPLVALSFFPFKGFWLRLWPVFPFPHPTFMPWKSLFGIVLCWTSHFAVHVLVGGRFASIPLTSGTPLFWLWHAFIDDLYYGWEQAREHQHGHTASAHGAQKQHHQHESGEHH